MSVARRAIPHASSIEEATKELRGNWLQVIEQHHMKHSGSTIENIIDIGCSVGVSTRFLADKFPSAKVTVSAYIYLWKLTIRHVLQDKDL